MDLLSVSERRAHVLLDPIHAGVAVGVLAHIFCESELDAAPPDVQAGLFAIDLSVDFQELHLALIQGALLLQPLLLGQGDVFQSLLLHTALLFQICGVFFVGEEEVRVSDVVDMDSDGIREILAYGPDNHTVFHLDVISPHCRKDVDIDAIGNDLGILRILLEATGVVVSQAGSHNVYGIPDVIQVYA